MVSFRLLVEASLPRMPFGDDCNPAYWQSGTRVDHYNCRSVRVGDFIFFGHVRSGDDDEFAGNWSLYKITKKEEPGDHGNPIAYDMHMVAGTSHYRADTDPFIVTLAHYGLEPRSWREFVMWHKEDPRRIHTRISFMAPSRN